MGTDRPVSLRVVLGTLCAVALVAAPPCLPADLQLPGINISIGGHGGESRQDMATAMKILLGLTVLSLAPAFLIAVTAFTRIIVVLSMLRHALGMQETPPNVVLIALALFLTGFTMMPVLQQIDARALRPYNAGELSLDRAFEAGFSPLRDFMVRQTREEDLALMVSIAHSPQPRSVDDIAAMQLIPAFMLSELRTAFQIGFVVFLPFLLIDLLVSSVLMAMGMFMVPPVVISLPIKVLMFVLIDGWNLVVRAVVGSFH